MKTCTLNILDEVNVKFDGLDPNVRREMVSKLKFEIPGARYMPAVRLGRWDGKKSFCSMGGATYINVLDIVLPVVTGAGYDVQLVDHREPHDFNFSEVDEKVFSGKTWPAGHPKAGEEIVLRDYQVNCINEYLQNLQSIQEISTGAGKTIITAALSHLVEQHTGGRTIVIVPNKDLVRQTREDYENVGLEVGVYFGDQKDIGTQHTICTWQSLNSLKKMGTVDGLNVIEAFLDGVNCVIVDECFDGDTEITMSDGSIKKIKDISIGDQILNFSEKDGVWKFDEVIKVHKNLLKSNSEKMYELQFDNGKSVKVTGNHKFLTSNRGWIRADELTSEDDIINI